MKAMESLMGMIATQKKHSKKKNHYEWVAVSRETEATYWT
jgi:hypothetical protein